MPMNSNDFDDFLEEISYWDNINISLLSRNQEMSQMDETQRIIFVEAIKKHETLNELWLPSGPVFFIEALKNKSVKCLVLEGDWNTQAIEALCLSLENHPSIKRIYLKRCKFQMEKSTTNMKKFTEALKSTNVEFLRIEGYCELSINDAEAIADLIQGNDSIVQLELSEVYICQAGLEKISQSLSGNNCIEALSLDRVFLLKDASTEHFVQFIVKILSKNESLKKLSLMIQLQGLRWVQDLCSAIAYNHNTKLEFLDLGYVMPISVGIKKIIKYLEHNHTVSTIVINGFNIATMQPYERKVNEPNMLSHNYYYQPKNVNCCILEDAKDFLNRNAELVLNKQTQVYKDSSNSNELMFSKDMAKNDESTINELEKQLEEAKAEIIQLKQELKDLKSPKESENISEEYSIFSRCAIS